MNLCHHGNRVGIDYCAECRREDHEEDMRLDAEERDDFDAWQKRVDLGLRRGEEGIEKDIIPAQKGLRTIYERLFEAIFGVRPKKGE